MIAIQNPISSCRETSIAAEQWVSETMQLLVDTRVTLDEQVRGMLGSAAYIDEMSLLFTSPHYAKLWVDTAVRLNGVTLFNTADDTVRTSPIRSDYNVHYWFLTAPEGHSTAERTWRIEVMYAHIGSPLHDSHLLAMRAAGQECGIIHASFKCATEEAYGDAVVALAKNAYEPAQHCESSYGKFSYWYPLELGHHDIATALKPRVNLRDMESDDE